MTVKFCYVGTRFTWNHQPSIQVSNPSFLEVFWKLTVTGTVFWRMTRYFEWLLKYSYNSYIRSWNPPQNATKPLECRDPLLNLHISQLLALPKKQGATKKNENQGCLFHYSLEDTQIYQSSMSNSSTYFGSPIEVMIVPISISHLTNQGRSSPTNPFSHSWYVVAFGQSPPRPWHVLSIEKTFLLERDPS